MSKKKSKLSISELEAEIQRHNDLYFKENDPEISDEAFDLLVQELKERQPDSEILHRLVSDLSSNKKVTHLAPMLSLDKCYSLEELMKWIEKTQGDFIITPKMDGVALSIRYDQKGHLALAATRGNGSVGEDVTANVREIRDIPQEIAMPSLEVRGEVYMRLSIFESMEGEYKSPRNLAAGAIKQKDPKKTADYALNFAAYEILGLDLKSEKEKFDTLKKLGFCPVEYKQIGRNEEELASEYQTYLKKRLDLDYEMDGVVYRCNDTSEHTRLGASQHHPKWAIAYKFQGESGITVLEEVHWSVARTGVITPVAIVAPVFLSGAQVRRISLHNLGMMKKLSLSMGAQVEAVRRGGVIPHLERVVQAGKGLIEIPETCPSCGSPTRIDEDFLYCSEPETCRHRQEGEIQHFIKVLEIDHLGEKLISQLFDHGLVTRPVQLFFLKEKDLLNLDRMGEKLAQKILRNIHNAKEVSLVKFLASLGIREFAQASVKLLVKALGTLESIRRAKQEELESIHGIGPIMAAEIVDGLKKKSDEIDDLLKCVHISEKAIEAGSLGGQSFLFTGKMSSMGRKEAAQKVKDLGGEVLGNPHSDLDVLVVGDEDYQAQRKGTKWLRTESLIAKGAKTKIVSESEFLALIVQDV